MAKGSSRPTALENNNVASLHSSSVQNIQNEVSPAALENNNVASLHSSSVQNIQNKVSPAALENNNVASLHSSSVLNIQNEVTESSQQNQATVHSGQSGVAEPSEQNEGISPCEQNEGIVASELNETIVPSELNEAIVTSELNEGIVSSEQNEGIVPSELNEGIVPSELNEGIVPSEQNEANMQIEQNEATVPIGQNEATVPSEKNEVIIPSKQGKPTLPSELSESTVTSEQNEAIVLSEQNEATMPIEQNEATVPIGQNETTVPSEKNEATMPCEQNEATVPIGQNETTVPSEKNEATMPSEKNKVTVPSEQNKAAMPSEQNKVNELSPIGLSVSESFRGGVIPDFSCVDKFHLRVLVNPCDEDGATCYSHGSYEGATVHSHHQVEGATGYSKHLSEGATGYSKHLSEGATGYSKHLSEGATGYSKHLSEGATGYSKHLSEGATGFSQNLSEEATGCSKELCEGATSCSKDSSQSSDVLTRYDSAPTSCCQDTDGRWHTCNKDSSLLPSAQQMNQHVFPRSRLNGRELSPLRDSYSSGEKHGEKIRLHKERYDTPKEHCSKLHVNHLKAVKPYKTHIEDLRERVKEKYHPSVGKILFCMKFKGTCFVVGRLERRFIVTANHIFEDIGEYFKLQKSELAIKKVIVQFESDDKNTPPIYYRLNSQVRHYSNNLDYLAVEMVPHKEFGFPPPIREFGRISHLINDKRVICIAFQNGELWRDMTGALYLADIRGRLESMKLDSRELLDLKKEVYAHKMHMIATNVIDGSSGGIVVLADSDLTMRVIGMILKGYPKEFYEDPSGYRKREGCHLVEVMISIEEIANDFNCVKNEMGKKFLKEVFGRF